MITNNIFQMFQLVLKIMDAKIVITEEWRTLSTLFQNSGEAYSPIDAITESLTIERVRIKYSVYKNHPAQFGK